MERGGLNHIYLTIDEKVKEERDQGKVQLNTA